MDGKMGLITVQQAKAGDRVILVKPDPAYDIDSRNPVRGSKWFCEGKIQRVNESLIYVEWDNGRTNTYKKNELGYAMPKAEGVCETIW